MNNNTNVEISNTSVFHIIMECRKNYILYLYACCISIILAVVVSLLTPRLYAAQIKMADEHKEMGLLLGQNEFEALIMQNASVGDYDNGINDPEIYSLMLESRNFLSSLADIRVEKYSTTLRDYLRVYHKKTIIERIKTLLNIDYDEDEYFINILHDNIKYRVHKRFSLILMQYTDNDPIVAAQIVDSIRFRMQKEITRHRISKAKYNIENTRESRLLAYREYKEKEKKFTTYADTHRCSISKETVTMMEQLSQDVRNAFDIYNKAYESEKRAEYLLQKTVPAFTVIKSAYVSHSPIQPKPIVLACVFSIISFIITTWFIMYKMPNAI